jgi:hypothetical protein
MKGSPQSNNAFVKSEQNKMRSKMGDRPGAPPEMKKFNAFMSNNGETTRACSNKVAGSLEDAFPLNKNLTVE